MAPPPNRPADRMMNDSTMPPPRYINANVNANASGIVNANANANVSVKKVSKPAVNPRHRFGLHDWKKLLSVSTDLAQRKGQPIRRDLTPDEVRKHDKNHDGWIILRGRVYNIGPYLPYHPGGVSIFKNLLGKDATAMFDKYHRWVNIDGLIGPLLLGFLAVPPTTNNQFSIVPPKESHLINAPRVSTQAASSTSLLFAPQNDENDDEDDEKILPPAWSSSSSTQD